jgi:transketolase
MFPMGGGDDVLLFSTGGMLANAMAVAERLRDSKIETSVVSVPWVRPLDEEFVRRRSRQVQLVVTLEEHSVVGGLGGAIAEVVSEEEDAAPLLRLGLPVALSSVVGDQQYLLSHYGLDPETATKRISDRLARRSAAPDD